MNRPAPKNATQNRNIAITAMVRLRFLNSRRSMSGCVGRNAWKMNARISSAPMMAGISYLAGKDGALLGDRGHPIEERRQTGRQHQHADEVEGLRRARSVLRQHYGLSLIHISEPTRRTPISY